MNKSKILSVALTAAVVASVAAVSTSASALTSAEVKDHSVGITGAFPACEEWTKDIAMTDDNNDGIYEAEIKDVPAGDYEFKVRLDGAWDASWGEYEWKDASGADADRTQNSQTNCKVTVADGQVVKVTFDTTKISEKALAQDGSYAKELSGADDEDAYNFWPVTYTVEDAKSDDDTSKDDTSKDDTSKDDTSKDDASKDDAKKDDTKTSDTSTVPTGDTTSAIALVAVVLASLGTAVVMTKKASSKN